MRLDENDRLRAGTLPDDPEADAVPYAPESGPVPVTVRAANGFQAGHGNRRTPPVHARWPAPMRAEARHGLAGRIVAAIEPHTEADPVALLAQFLGALGNVIGLGPYFMADGARHALKLFVAIVADTAKGRKGTSWARILGLFKEAEPDWADACVLSGLSSGEGLIWSVRDKALKTEKDRKTGEYQEVVADAGVTDKRALVVEAELASTMAVMARQGNTLSPVIRDAWDKSDLRSLTKNSPARSTGAHVSIIGHVTGDELRRNLDRTELGNGFANRFLWICARRARSLAFGGQQLDLCAHVDELREVIDFSKQVGEITWADDARPLWEEKYPELSEGRPGVFGAVTARAEAQTVRLACIYALLDQSNEIREVHLRAALAVWDFAAASAAWIWGRALGDPTADALLSMLRAAGENGMSRTQIRDAFGRNRGAEDVERALGVLQSHGLATSAQAPSTGGRPPELWFATTETTKTTEGDER